MNDHQLADYVASRSLYAVREACELIIGATGNYEAVVSNRAHFSETYEQYLATRQAVETHYFTVQDQELRRTEI